MAISTLTYGLIGCLLAIHFQVSHSQLLPYNCAISGCQGAPGSQCDTGTGNCNCDGGITDPDYACNAKTAGCGTTCVTANTVTDVNNACLSPTQCLCKAGWTGVNCDVKRVNAVCGSAGMDLTVTPYVPVGAGAFTGNIYLKATNAFTAPGDFPAAADNCNIIGAALTTTNILYAGGGAGCDLGALTPAAGVYSVWAYVQLNENFRGTSDHIIEIQCAAANTDIDSTADVTVTDGNPAVTTPITSTHAADVSGMTMALKKNPSAGSYQPITTATNLVVGDDLSLVFEYTDKFTIRTCTAYNYDPAGAVPATAKTLPMIVEWCVTPGALSIFRGPIVWFNGATGDATAEGADNANSKTIRLDLDAFYFMGAATRLYFRCNACVGCNPNPAPAGCSNSLTSYATQSAFTRRRRAADDEATIEATMGVSVEVNQGGSLTVNVQDPTSNDSSSSENCYKKTSVILPLCILAGLLLCAMFMSFFFCHKLTYGKHGEDNAAYKS